MLIIKVIREFFWEKGFLEVETPLLVNSLIPESTISHFNTDLIDISKNKKKMFLTSSPEASHKKLLSVGSGNIFEITKSFRNKEDGVKDHNSEFTILEWYEVGKSYKDTMKTSEDLISFLVKFLNSKYKKLSIKNKKNISKIKKDLKVSWEKIRFIDAWDKYINIPYSNLYNPKTKTYLLKNIITITRELGLIVSEKNTWEEIFNQVFLNLIEPKLIADYHSFFIYDYPTPLAALAKIDSKDPRFAQRFELYINGLEIANGYEELTDYDEQKRRFENEAKIIIKKGDQDYIADQDLFEALKRGLPKCSGVALGIDRLVMLFAGAKSIDEVILFPNSEM